LKNARYSVLSPSCSPMPFAGYPTSPERASPARENTPAASLHIIGIGTRTSTDITSTKSGVTRRLEYSGSPQSPVSRRIHKAKVANKRVDLVLRKGNRSR
jgi:hypothetical protein